MPLNMQGREPARLPEREPEREESADTPVEHADSLVVDLLSGLDQQGDHASRQDATRPADLAAGGQLRRLLGWRDASFKVIGQGGDESSMGRPAPQRASKRRNRSHQPTRSNRRNGPHIYPNHEKEA